MLIDDSEGPFPSFSYDKLLGITELSATDREDTANGKDNTVDRTRRLLYVCVSRAREELAVVIYATNVEAAILALKVNQVTDQPLTLTEILSDLAESPPTT